MRFNSNTKYHAYDYNEHTYLNKQYYNIKAKNIKKQSSIIYKKIRTGINKITHVNK